MLACRRYADVIVHRLLQCSLTHEPFPLACNEVHNQRQLQCAQDGSQARLGIHHLPPALLFTSLLTRCNPIHQEASSDLFLWAYLTSKGHLTEEAAVLGFPRLHVSTAPHWKPCSAIDISRVSFDVLVMRLGFQVRVNLELQQNELSFQAVKGYAGLIAG